MSNNVGQNYRMKHLVVLLPLRFILRFICAFSLSVTFFLPGALADIVILKNGGRFEGKVTVKGDMVEVMTTKGATFSLPRSNIARIIKKKLPEEELTEREAQVDKNDAGALFQLALWCRQNRFNAKHEKYLKMALAVDPNHREARELLYHYQKVYKKLPVNKAAAARLRAEFGPGFKLYYTRHFRICHNCDDGFAEYRGKLFEAVYSVFYGFFERRRFPLITLKDRLEVVLFDTREQFRAYARIHAPATESAAGFYLPKNNRVAFFNTLNTGEYRQIRQAILAQEKQVNAMRKQIKKIRASHFTLTFPDGRRERYTKRDILRVLAKEERKVRARRRELQAYYKNENVTTTAHECLHQLAFNLGVQSLEADNPKWLAEGLATFFETVNYAMLTEVGEVNTERLKVFKKLYSNGHLIPLKRLLTMDSLFTVSANSAIPAYAEAWGLTHFLFNKHEKEFIDYILKLRNKRVYKVTSRGLLLLRKVTAAERLRDFQEAFGDIEKLEKEWRLYMMSLK